MSAYSDKLDAVCAAIESMPDSSGGEALRAVVLDLEGAGPVGGMLFSLDQHHFDMVIALLVEFRRTGRSQPFNSLHAAARKRVALP